MGRYTHLDVDVIILTVLVHMVLSTKVYRRTWEGVWSDFLVTTLHSDGSTYE